MVSVLSLYEIRAISGCLKFLSYWQCILSWRTCRRRQLHFVWECNGGSFTSQLYWRNKYNFVILNINFIVLAFDTYIVSSSGTIHNTKIGSTVLCNIIGNMKYELCNYLLFSLNTIIHRIYFKWKALLNKEKYRYKTFQKIEYDL